MIIYIFSFFIALFYIEFSSRYPSKFNSTFDYIYGTTCELIAFIVGWTLILEYIIGAACVSRAFTLYLDTLLNNTLINEFHDIAPLKWNGVLGDYFDFIGLILPILIGGKLSSKSFLFIL